MPDAPHRLEIGRVGRPHGLRGDVTALLVSDRPERTAPGAVLHAGDRELVVETARPHKQGWIIRFEGVTDVDGAEALRGEVLTAEPLDGDDDDLFVHDLIGAAVRDRDGRALGEVVAVEANPAHDLLVLDRGGLVPLPFVVHHEPGLVVVDPPAGLLGDEPASREQEA